MSGLFYLTLNKLLEKNLQKNYLPTNPTFPWAGERKHTIYTFRPYKNNFNCYIVNKKNIQSNWWRNKALSIVLTFCFMCKM